MIATKGYAAHSAKDSLKPFSFDRRDPKATDVHDSSRYVPLDRILVETDAPYLAPVPYRGKRNEPSYVTYTANRVAELRGMDPEELGETVVRNFDTITA